MSDLTAESSQPLVFDCHLDLSMNAMEWNRDLTRSLEYIRRREQHQRDQPDRGNGIVCFPEMRRGNMGLCVATQIARSVNRFSRMPGWSSASQAWAQTQGQLAWYREMEAAGELRFITDRAGLEAHLADWQRPSTERKPIGYILSLEGADSLHTPAHLERAYAYGLRAVGLTHYGPGLCGAGTDDEGPLSAYGRELLVEVERLGLILDVTHLSDESFRDALDRFSGPVWASHSNCRALADWNRQFTDDQIRELIGRDAVIGVAVDAIMMVHGWRHLRSKPADFDLSLEHLANHIDHICQLAGNARHVGIGTDADGGFGTEQMPADLGSIADIQKLGPILSRRGYSKVDIDGIFHGNFLALLRRVWK
jgi:membrane dipeptidase